MDAQEILARARAAEDAQVAAYTPPDYRAANKAHTRQKAALTRAVNSKDPDKVVLACTKAVAEWRAAPFNGAWPDDWSRWQRALDDALPWQYHVRLENLRAG